MNRRLPLIAASLVLAALNFGGSCASDNNDERADERRSVDADQPNRIPRDADLVREGWDRLKWTADMDGTIYVFDKDKKTIRYIGPVRRGDEIMVQPDRDKVYVGGRIVFDQNLQKHSWHKLYFVRGGEQGQDLR
jgi:hypothetical protein